jgi:hypothetical protein
MILELSMMIKKYDNIEIHMTYRYKLETIKPIKIIELQKLEILVIVRDCMSLIHLYDSIYMKYMILEVQFTRCHMRIRTVKWFFKANFNIQQLSHE